MSSTTSLTLPLLPLSAGVVLPQMVVTVVLETDDARSAADAALAQGGEARHVLLVPRVDGRFARVGVIAVVETSGELPNSQRALVVRGVGRAVIGSGVTGPVAGPALWVEATPVDTTGSTRIDASDGRRELAREYRATVRTLLEQHGAARLIQGLQAIDDAGTLADTINYWPELSLARRVELLETLDSVDARLGLALAWAKEALVEADLRERIRSDVSSGVEKQQREYLLRQQLAAIRKELGESEGASDAAGSYRARLQALTESGALAEPVRTAIEREVDRLERTSEQSPEQSWIRTWLDTILDIPWGARDGDTAAVSGARAVLDSDTTGLDDAKDRIVEWIAVRTLRRERGFATEEGGGARRGEGAIIALVGPPGVGKTSLGESVARALGRRFVRVALGGIRDEAEIRGHRRTYVGAQPGRIVRALREAKTMNPVILLDEIDKLTTGGWSGDPAAALLEVLDPAQNHTFRDHYLEVDLDLSDVVFVTTANQLDTIPGPLLDRMEIITVDGYTDLEKMSIARNHLMGRQLRAAGLRDGEVVVSDEALQAVVEGYTREAGVRGLERQIGKLFRKAAMQIAARPGAGPVVLGDAGSLRPMLGRPRHVREEVADRVAVPGVATGLAVTGAGGDVLFVEATVSPGTGTGPVGLTVTGQLGDVMKESAQIALSYVRSHAESLGVAREQLDGKNIHIHFPAGAIPKDGPSAGITMTTALVSLLTDRPVRATVGMTGEVTLQGRVLPIGGVKQKLLAAHRAGLRTVILPARNEGDLDDVPDHVRADLDIHLADDVTEVIALALA